VEPPSRRERTAAPKPTTDSESLWGDLPDPEDRAKRNAERAKLTENRAVGDLSDDELRAEANNLSITGDRYKRVRAEQDRRSRARDEASEAIQRPPARDEKPPRPDKVINSEVESALIDRLPQQPIAPRDEELNNELNDYVREEVENRDFMDDPERIADDMLENLELEGRRREEVRKNLIDALETMMEDKRDRDFAFQEFLAGNFMPIDQFRDEFGDPDVEKLDDALAKIDDIRADMDRATTNPYAKRAMEQQLDRHERDLFRLRNSA
jgi:hypothetical protein